MNLDWNDLYIKSLDALRKEGVIFLALTTEDQFHKRIDIIYCTHMKDDIDIWFSVIEDDYIDDERILRMYDYYFLIYQPERSKREDSSNGDAVLWTLHDKVER